MSLFFDLATDSLAEGETIVLEDFILAHGFKPDFIMIRMDDVVVRREELRLRQVTRSSRIRVYRLVGGG